MSEWKRPVADVVSVRSGTPTSFLTLRLPPGLAPPLAPASLWRDETSIVDLHWVVQTEGGTTTFRTTADVPDDIVGAALGFQQWWTPDQLALVAETWRPWTAVSGAPPGAPDFCQLGWEPADAPSGPASGWVSGDAWICDRCHESYIVHDRLAIRS